jgi:hypothetical protein
MASEPINIFSRTIGPAEVRDAVLSRHPAATVDAEGADWRRITVPFGKGKKARRLTLLHDPDYYAGPGWPNQRRGMQGYFSRFPDPSGRLPQVLALIGTFQFSLGTQFDPDWDDPSSDERFAIVCGLARMLDGVLFSPSGLRDPDGRLLFGAAGDFDPEARWPTVRATAQAVADGVLEAGPDGPNPPSADRVARRAVALMGVTGRAVVERDFRSGEMSAEEAADVLTRLRNWIGRLGVEDELEPAEQQLLQAEPGKLTDRQMFDAGWRIEGLAVLAWALGRAPLPRYDELVNIDDVWGSVGFLRPDAAETLLKGATLRPVEELQAYRKQMLGLHWRLRDFRQVKAKRMNFRAFAANCWFGSFDVSLFELIDDELALRGHRLNEAPADILGAASGIALERHLAINWLCYGPAVYSKTYVGT